MNEKEFKIEKKSDHWIILHSQRWGYSLHYRGHVLEPLSGKQFHFSVGNKGEPSFDISCRDLKAETRRAGYNSELSEIVETPDLTTQYVEIGAGLGEFIPALVKNSRLRYKPIVVDPARYDLMAEMFYYFKRFIFYF